MKRLDAPNFKPHNNPTGQTHLAKEGTMLPMWIRAFLVAGFGLMATLGWMQVSAEFSRALVHMSAYGCTFACNSLQVTGFWSAAFFAAIFTGLAVAVLSLALVQRRG